MRNVIVALWSSPPSAAALLVAASLLFLGAPKTPSLAAYTATCDYSAGEGCCACYTEDDEFRCHGGAKLGSTYCDSGTEFCAKTFCHRSLQ